MTKKDVREKFRNDVFKRDKNKCVLCGDSESNLDAHHITNRKEMPNGGYVKENGITVCDKPDGCHRKVEAYYFLQNGYKDSNNPLHPEQLYKLIGSSFTLAFEASSKLL